MFAQESVYEKECRIIDGYINSGDFVGGIDYLKQKIAIYDSSESFLDSNYSFYQQELGKLYYYIGEFNLAEKAIIESINFDKDLLGERSDDYISGLSVLSELYREMGLYEKSLSISKQLSLLYSQIEITDSTGYAYFLNNAGALYLSIGNLSNAEIYFDSAKIICNNLFSENHPDVAPLLNNLGHFYKEKGQYAKAEKSYLKMMEIDKRHFGDHHVIIAQDLSNLGVLNSTIGNFALAEKQLNLAKNIYEDNNDKRLGYVYTLSNLVVIHLLRNELSEAELLCNNALKITDTLVVKSHDINTSLLSRLSNIYYSRKDYEHAIAILSESTEILRSTNPYHIDLVNQLYNMGRSYDDLKENGVCNHYP